MISKVEDKKYFSFKGLLVAFLMAVIYLIVPQLVGALFYYVLKLPEMPSVFIGNVCAALLFVLLLWPLLKKQFNDFTGDFSNNFHDCLKYWGIGLGVMMVTNIILNVFVFPGQIAENEELNRSFLTVYPIIGFFEVSLLILQCS